MDKVALALRKTFLEPDEGSPTVCLSLRDMEHDMERAGYPLSELELETYLSDCRRKHGAAPLIGIGGHPRVPTRAYLINPEFYREHEQEINAVFNRQTRSVLLGR